MAYIKPDIFKPSRQNRLIIPLVRPFLTLTKRVCFKSSESNDIDPTTDKSNYDFQTIERRWQNYWDENNTFQTPKRDLNKKKKYVLDMFPYPSAAGLHVGHPLGYTASDVMARYWRMNNYDVLHPMGWDAFGLPAEQYAIQTGTQPSETTHDNILNFKYQLKKLGFSYDWSKELATTDHSYVKWTQWFFLQFYKRGLAEQKYVNVNWCEKLGTVLANEEVINGRSERGDYPVQRVPLRQWVLKITKYADRLVHGLKELDWPSGTKMAQQQWIGKSDGYIINFPMESDTLSIYTTRADSIMGVTFLTVAPEHSLLSTIVTKKYMTEVADYVKSVSSRSELNRMATKELTGVFTGRYALHPLTGQKIPIWVADYVLISYGTGAIMSVPAHNEKDYRFAIKYNLPLKWVIRSCDTENNTKSHTSLCFNDHGILMNSGLDLDNLPSLQAQTNIINKLLKKKLARSCSMYKLRDWVFSRQRYWGEPIPIYFPIDFPQGIDPLTVHPLNVNHTIRYDIPIPVRESDLPIKLPLLNDFKPGLDPEGCLARAEEWRYFKYDGKWYARETNTMPQWAGSCWYYLRFIDTDNKSRPFSTETDIDWMPVDLYVGGSEHAVLHLLYARFWHHILFDMGLTTHPEPFRKLIHQGMILGTDGEKMSKSRGNVINPDDVISQYGADVLRLYELFMGPLQAVKPWQSCQISGVVRFRNKFYSVIKLATSNTHAELSHETVKLFHQTMKKVTKCIETVSFHTAISSIMILVNHIQTLPFSIPLKEAEILTMMISPFAPHLGEECWKMLGHTRSIAYHPWVEYDKDLCTENITTIAIQVNGKLRGTVKVPKESIQDVVMEEALTLPRVLAYINGKEVTKIIFVPDKILNLVCQ